MQWTLLGDSCGPVFTPIKLVTGDAHPGRMSLAWVSDKEEKMLNEMLLTTTLCVAIVGVMALFYGELELLQNHH